MTGLSIYDRHIMPEPMSGCWLWIGSHSKDGYGRVTCRRLGGSSSAHKAVYEMTYDSAIPVGYELDHTCRTRSCVNPKHLEIVTHQVNCQRGNIGLWQKLKTVCKNGHPLDEQNAHVRPNGRRRCRACGRNWTNHARQARRLQRV